MKASAKRAKRAHALKKKKKKKNYATSSNLYWSYYSHRSRELVSPVCGIFKMVLLYEIITYNIVCRKPRASSGPTYIKCSKTSKGLNRFLFLEPTFLGISLSLALKNVPKYCPICYNYRQRSWSQSPS